MDITEIIMFQHEEQRRQFAYLDELRDEPTEVLGAVWERLAALLEVHAAAEEKFFYPEVLRLGTGHADADSAEEETEDAIGDHNDIRDAVRAAADAEVGTDAWWKAVTDARISNDDHMGEEERQDLADFRLHAGLDLRHEIAVKFLGYEAQNWQGVDRPNQDPEEYVEQNS